MAKTSPSSADAPYLHLIQDVPFQPIFILGRARSGTTILHQLLAQSGNFNYLSVYHVVHHPEILFNHVNGRAKTVRDEMAAEFKAMRLEDREIDHMGVTPDTAEEYGFILHGADYPAAFNFTGPRYIRPYKRFMVNDYNRDLFLNLARKVQYTSDPEKPVLFKNPADYLDFQYLHRLIPHAKFVFIHRHPVHVMNSQIKTSRDVASKRNAYYALIDPTYAALHDKPLRLLVARLFANSKSNLKLVALARNAHQILAHYINNIGSLDRACYINIRYEDLMQDPAAVTNRIFEFLNITPQAPLSFNLIKPRPVKLLPELQSYYDQICDILQDDMTFHGYVR